MNEEVRVLFVCLGNICRSPLAQGIFNQKIENGHPPKKLYSDSCGTSDWHIGEPPDPRSIEIARLNGIELNHLGRQIQVQDFKDFDYILAMDRENLRSLKEVEARAPLSKAKTMLMREFDPEAESQDVPDPYFGGPEGFDSVYRILDRCCDRLIDYIEGQHRNGA